MLIPLLAAALAALPASAQTDASDPSAALAAMKAQAAQQAQSAQAQAKQAGATRRGYLVPPINSPDYEEFRRLVFAISVRHTEAGGGPEHIASLVGEPCAMVPSGCVALVEPLADWVAADGDKASPYVYSALEKVLAVVGEHYHSLAALNQVEAGFVPVQGWPPYQGRGASFAAGETLRRLEASTAGVKYDRSNLHISAEANGSDKPLAQMGAELAGLYDDAPKARLSEPLKTLVFSSDPGVAIASLRSLKRLEPTMNTLAVINRLITDQDTHLPRRDVPDAVQIEALKQTGDLAWLLWRQKWDDSVKPARTAVFALRDDAQDAKRPAVAEAAAAALTLFPKPPTAPAPVQR